jgi:hypothetical protein
VRVVTDETEGAPSQSNEAFERQVLNRRRRLLRIATAAFALCVALAASYFAHRAARKEAGLSAEPMSSGRARTPSEVQASASAAKKRYAVQGPSTKADPMIARKRALEEKTEFGMIGPLIPTGGDAGQR